MERSNYEITKRGAQKLFLNYDQPHIIEKFGLEHDADYLYLEFVARPYRISRSSGAVEWSAQAQDGPWHEAEFEDTLSILDVLCCSRDDCHLSGNFCSISNVKGAALAAAPGNDMFAPSARAFDHRTDRLAAACEALGGTRETVGDVSYSIPVFPFLSVRLQFWDSDEEFPPTLKFMWDENILQYMRFETTFYVTGHLISRLKELAFGAQAAYAVKSGVE